MTDFLFIQPVGLVDGKYAHHFLLDIKNMKKAGHLNNREISEECPESLSANQAETMLRKSVLFSQEIAIFFCQLIHSS